MAQWNNGNGTVTPGVVIEDGAGNKINSFGGGGGGGSGGATTVADGADVAQGTTTDSAGASTIMGQIKSVANSLTSILTKLLGSVAVTGTFWPTTQPVSGAVIANIGATNGLALDASLQSILAALTAQIDISGSLWADPTLNPVVYYIRRESKAEAPAEVNDYGWTPGGVSASPTVVNLVSVSNAKNIAQETVIYTATSAGTGYAAGDILIHAFGIDTVAATPALAYSIWMNAGPSVASGSILASAPTGGTYIQAAQAISAAALPLPANAAQETGGNLAALASNVSTSALQTTGNTLLTNLVGKFTLSNSNVLVQDNTVAAAITAAALTPPVQMRAQSINVTDLAAGTVITATANGSTLVLDSGSTYGAVVNITAISGTSAYIQPILQESLDGGVTWDDIYHLPRIFATGAYKIPNMLFLGQRRWRWVVGGTSPSIAMGIIATRGTGAAPLIRSFYDYSIAPNTAGSTSATWKISGVRNGQMSVSNASGATTNAIFQLSFSPDGSNFVAMGSTIQPASNVLLMTTTSTIEEYVRIAVVTVGVGATLNYARFYGTN